MSITPHGSGPQQRTDFRHPDYGERHQHLRLKRRRALLTGTRPAPGTLREYGQFDCDNHLQPDRLCTVRWFWTGYRQVTMTSRSLAHGSQIRNCGSIIGIRWRDPLASAVSPAITTSFWRRFASSTKTSMRGRTPLSSSTTKPTPAIPACASRYGNGYRVSEPGAGHSSLVGGAQGLGFIRRGDEPPSRLVEFRRRPCNELTRQRRRIAN